MASTYNLFTDRFPITADNKSRKSGNDGKAVNIFADDVINVDKQIIAKYGRQCIICGDGNRLEKTNILPSDTCRIYNINPNNFGIYNNLIMRSDISIGFLKFEFTVRPIILATINRDNSVWVELELFSLKHQMHLFNDKGKIKMKKQDTSVKGYSPFEQKNTTKTITVLFSTLYFLKWHYLQYLKHNKIRSYDNPDDYLKTTIFKINACYEDRVVDADNDVIMYESID
ncbi:MAG: hypothetical protein Faunusvirus54_5 [Faunusvirus sp.]|jgi:hypothetical protein|uniref:Uncharacterized protein n=1 Tax=Faunusvirus sp. TaxID=2487766 RepID=A0A3G5A0M2_9VIRU|nr:MAG: hypothetical protein Faunusvirus54_5 [Faunusvirus sp.]